MPITAIYGPLCLEIVFDYIAHETDTPEVPVPIIQEDGQIIIPEDAVFGGGAIECFEGDHICCTDSTVLKFVNEDVTEIAWGAVLQSKYGSNPTVFVYYFNPEDDSFSIAGHYTRISFDGDPLTKLTIDHGGTLETGFIKIM